MSESQTNTTSTADPAPPAPLVPVPQQEAAQPPAAAVTSAPPPPPPPPASVAPASAPVIEEKKETPPAQVEPPRMPQISTASWRGHPLVQTGERLSVIALKGGYILAVRADGAAAIIVSVEEGRQILDPAGVTPVAQILPLVQALEAAILPAMNEGVAAITTAKAAASVPARTSLNWNM